MLCIFFNSSQLVLILEGKTKFVTKGKSPVVPVFRRLSLNKMGAWLGYRHDQEMPDIAYIVIHTAHLGRLLRLNLD